MAQIEICKVKKNVNNNKRFERGQSAVSVLSRGSIVSESTDDFSDDSPIVFDPISSSTNSVRNGSNHVGERDITARMAQVSKKSGGGQLLPSAPAMTGSPSRPSRREPAVEERAMVVTEERPRSYFEDAPVRHSTDLSAPRETHGSEGSSVLHALQSLQTNVLQVCLEMNCLIPY